MKIEQEIAFLKKYDQPVNCNQVKNADLRPIYFEMGVPGSRKDLYARCSVVKRLNIVSAALPQGYRLVIFDAFRSLESQKSLFDFYLQESISKGMSEEKAYELVSTYWSDPKKIKLANETAPHNSGGSIDLTLSYNGELLDMGTAFDEMSVMSKTDYFSTHKNDLASTDGPRIEQIIKNRHRLKSSMLNAGFTNYSEEWWHYDLGTKFWANEKKSNWQYDSLEQVLRSSSI